MSNHPNRTRRIWVSASGTVCLRDEDDFGSAIVREFWVPRSGGYVYEIDARHPGTLGQQVCDRLAIRGSTLVANSPEDLLDVIRREYRRAVAHQRHEAAKDRGC